MQRVWRTRWGRWCTVILMASGAPSVQDIANVGSGPLGRAQAAACHSGDSAGVVELSALCVGPLSVDSTLGSLRHHFPSAKEVPFSVEDRGPYAALMFRISGIEAHATQYRRAIAWDRPARAWMITGSGASLPGGVPITGSWADLRRAYTGRVVLLNPELGINVEFCDAPGMIIYLQMEPSADSLVRETRRPEDIPTTATISAVLIDRGWRSACSKRP
jgi:hypothetical protein